MILLIDDHEMILRGVIQFLKEHEPRWQVSTARSEADALSEVSKRQFALVVSAINLPGRGGLALISHLHRLCERTPILVYSMHDESQFGLAAVRTGAHGYVCKAEGGDRLLCAMRALRAGRLFLSEETLMKSAGVSWWSGEKDLHDCLSARELQVFRLLVDGRSVKEIASELWLSAKTVSTYHVRIREKMLMHSDSALIRYALERNLFATLHPTVDVQHTPQSAA